MKSCKSRLLNRFWDLLFPPRCLGCAELMIPGKGALCPICRGKWEQEKRLCFFGRESGREQRSFKILLPQEVSETETFSALPREGIGAVCLSAYFPGKNTVTNHMILRAKDQKLSAQRKFLSSELARVLPGTDKGLDTDQVVLSYIPRQPSKVRISGVDQAREIARGLGEELGIRYVPLFSRHGKGDQKKKTAEKRFEGADQKYRLKRRKEEIVRGKEIWLCDDVITTGASMLTCAALLYRAGAKRVVAIAIARTAKNTEQEERHEEKNGN